jgi:CHAD domain-containing protein
MIPVVSFELHRRKHIEDQLVKIARTELRDAAAALTTSAASQFGTAVHEARKSVKKVRAIAALLEQAGAELPNKDRKRLKSAARALSRLRDDAAMVDTLDRLRHRYPKGLPEHTYGILRRGLAGQRNRQHARARRDGSVDEVAARLTKARKAARDWTAPTINAARMADIVADSYRRSRKAMAHARATGQSATLHRWRKALKILWYQLRLAKPLTTGVAPLVADLKRLETELGDDHNLVVLAARLRGCPDLRSLRTEIRTIDRLAARMRQPLRRRAFALGRRLHARQPKVFAGRMRTAVRKRTRRSAKPPRRRQAA